MPAGYRHLTRDQRCRIAVLKERDFSQKEIAEDIDAHPSTVSRELKRNVGKHGYSVKKAHKKAKKRRFTASSAPRKLTETAVDFIKKQLNSVQSSPEQISGRMAEQGMIAVGKTTIYRFLERDRLRGGSLKKHLRHGGKPYKTKGAKTAGRGLIPGRVDIDARPDIVEEKSRFGDFEGDTVIGKDHKGALLTLVDRASKLLIVRLLPDKKAEGLTRAALRALKKTGITPKTFTFDNGKEFAQHALITAKTGAPCYFAKPYHSWERGLNEHTNGLIRQYLPKGTDFTKITEKDVRNIEFRLNNRPRKSLNYKTPYEVYQQLTQGT